MTPLIGDSGLGIGNDLFGIVLDIGHGKAPC
jgi:hypothetical protein